MANGHQAILLNQIWIITYPKKFTVPTDSRMIKNMLQINKQHFISIFLEQIISRLTLLLMHSKATLTSMVKKREEPPPPTLFRTSLVHQGTSTDQVTKGYSNKFAGLSWVI